MFSSDPSVRRLQEEILKIYSDFKRICDENGLRYYAIGGTCIGALRHSGFIPWDDDLDVAMPIEDYKKFIELSKTKLQEGYALMTPDNCKHYLSLFMKLHNTNTTYIENLAKNYHDRYGGVYMDIFPIYGMPKSEPKRKKIQRKCQYYRQMNLRLRFPVSDDINKGILKKIVWILCAPLKLIFKFNHYTKKIDKMLSKYAFDCSDVIYFPWRSIPKSNKMESDMFYLEDFIKSIDVAFEETVMSIPCGYDRYLKRDFGDYMTPPPEKARIAKHPVVAVDFNVSYKFYKGN